MYSIVNTFNNFSKKYCKKIAMPTNKILFPCTILIASIWAGCIGAKQFKGPAGYDINQPEKFIMTSSLKEISGISFLNGKDDTTYAIEDEGGKLYYFSMGSDKVNHSKFGKKGDYEDVAVLTNKTVAVLKSDGSITVFAANEVGKEKIDSVKEYNNILPQGEYEGLFADTNKLIALCKNCPADKQKKEVSVFTIEQTKDAAFSVTNTFKIDISATQPDNGNEKFHPSGISKNPLTNEWFIISSVNRMLVITDQNWKVKEFFPLNPALFKQPEGLTFNKNGDMYISNEGGDGDGNVLLFKYHKK
jgi:uncharacterized protein YjiK